MACRRIQQFNCTSPETKGSWILTWSLLVNSLSFLCDLLIFAQKVPSAFVERQVRFFCFHCYLCSCSISVNKDIMGYLSKRNPCLSFCTIFFISVQRSEWIIFYLNQQLYLTYNYHLYCCTSDVLNKLDLNMHTKKSKLDRPVCRMWNFAVQLVPSQVATLFGDTEYLLNSDWSLLLAQIFCRISLLFLIQK